MSVFREMETRTVKAFYGAFCPICNDWIVRVEDILIENLEEVVIKHYEDFHTIKEIEGVRYEPKRG